MHDFVQSKCRRVLSSVPTGADIGRELTMVMKKKNMHTIAITPRRPVLSLQSRVDRSVTSCVQLDRTHF